MAVSAAPVTHAVERRALQLLVSAPHRLLFFIGATNILLAMGWWAAVLAGARWFGDIPSRLELPPGWLHAILMQYQVLPAFIFGFLLTVFPRWMDLPALSVRHYVPVGLGLFGGQILTLTGVAGGIGWLRAGAVLTAVGWAIGMLVLGRLAIRDCGRTPHAVSCMLALGFGLFGLIFYTLFLFRFDPRLMYGAIKIGGGAVLLPIFFTVCHRMIPFFANAVLSGYRMVRPLWALAALWPLAILHVAFELGHRYAWLWIVDAPIAVLAAGLLAAWWPRAGRSPALLRVLFIGFAWLPVAFVLYAAQSAWFARTGDYVLARAPAHALFIGYFGSLLVAMVTRVTQGHSGRPLLLGRIPAIAFVLVQATAVVRVIAEVLPDTLAWHAIAGILWIVAFLPWAARSGWIYLTPRVDGRP